MKDTYESNNYGPMEVVKYTNAKNVLVRFIETGYETRAHMQSIRAGHVTDHSFKTKLTEARREEKRARVESKDITPEDMKAGTVHATRNDEIITVLEYRGVNDVIAKFERSGVIFEACSRTIRKGNFRDPSIVLKERITKSDRLVKELRARCAYNPAKGVFTRKAGFTGVKVGSVLGSKDSGGKMQATIAGARIFVSHLVWLIECGELPDGALIHKNSIKSDDRFSNLEERVAPVRMIENYTAPAPAPAPALEEQDEQDTTGYRTEAARLLEEIHKIGERLQARGVSPL